MNMETKTYRHLMAGLAGLVLPVLGASGQAAGSLSQFEQPFGFAPGETRQPIDPGTRDANGNRLIVNGRILPGASGLDGGLATQWGQTAGIQGQIGTGTALGNQLNVVTNGSWNTVVIDSTQTNTGDQTVVLNGELDLDDQ